MCQIINPVQVSEATLHDRFLELLPRIETHGKIYFRHKKGAEKAEILQEMRALAWKWYRRLMQRGKDPAQFVFNFTRVLVRAVSCGRRVVGMEPVKDVLSPRCQREHSVRVEPLPSSTAASHETLYATVRGQHEHDALEERLRDNTQTPVPEQAAFRVDWPAWLQTLTDRSRRIIDDLMNGERTLDVSRKYGVSPGRVSQMREWFHDSWERFNADKGELAAAA
jgi:hypothetical protein